MDKQFTKEDMKMTNKHMKRCFILLIIKEMKIKATVKDYLTPIKIATIKN